MVTVPSSVTDNLVTEFWNQTNVHCELGKLPTVLGTPVHCGSGAGSVRPAGVSELRSATLHLLFPVKAGWTDGSFPGDACWARASHADPAAAVSHLHPPACTPTPWARCGCPGGHMWGPGAPPHSPGVPWFLGYSTVQAPGGRQVQCPSKGQLCLLCLPWLLPLRGCGLASLRGYPRCSPARGAVTRLLLHLHWPGTRCSPQKGTRAACGLQPSLGDTTAPTCPQPCHEQSTPWPGTVEGGQATRCQAQDPRPMRKTPSCMPGQH